MRLTSCRRSCTASSSSRPCLCASHAPAAAAAALCRLVQAATHVPGRQHQLSHAVACTLRGGGSSSTASTEHTGQEPAQPPCVRTGQPAAGAGRGGPQPLGALRRRLGQPAVRILPVSGSRRGGAHHPSELCLFTFRYCTAEQLPRQPPCELKGGSQGAGQQASPASRMPPVSQQRQLK